MEVLVSIGVVAIGLMGVATLIPLAFQQAETGAQNERKAALSKQAFREFHVLGMANPAMWVSPLGLLDPTNQPTNVAITRPDDVRSAFCIDPRWTALNAYAPTTGQYKQTPPKWQFSFPAVNANTFTLPEVIEHWIGIRGPAVMPRISLRAAPRSFTMLSPVVADEKFIAQNDLEFELPKQETLPPVQTALTGASGPLKRYAAGAFSWFATVVPQDGISDLYLLSIAVCHQRNLAKVNDLNTTDQTYETVVPVFVTNDPNVGRGYQQLVNASSGGDMLGVLFAGGDIRVDISQSGELAIKPGEYVMLSRHIATSGNFNGNTVFKQRFQWYRVVSIENDLPRRSAFFDAARRGLGPQTVHWA